MLAPRFVRPASLLARPFSSSTVAQRSPSIRDITPDSAAEFNARQKEFRENLEGARKKKEQQESQSVEASAPASASASASASAHASAPSPASRDRSREYATAPTAPPESSAGSNNVVDAAEILDQKALGSLSSHRIVGDEHQRQTSQAPKRGPLSSLIYGTKEGQQHDKDIERSFSQVLARGKYVHSIVFHEVKPDRVDEYVDLVGQWYPRMAGMEENRVNLVGSWRTQVGDNETFGT